jgi:hypothetical protein
VRIRLLVLVASCLGVVAFGSAAAQAGTGTPPDDRAGTSAECPVRPQARAVFMGTVEATDFRSARFRVLQVRAGSLDGLVNDDLVDVDYFDDVRFLAVGETYVVGAGFDRRTGRLLSKVREPAPRFGGNEVVALDELECPVFEDPVRTLDPNGTPVESGVLTPLYGEGRALARALLLPVLWVLGALLAVAAFKAVFVWVLRGLSRLTHPNNAKRT